jgi:hypothetical protein
LKENDMRGFNMNEALAGRWLSQLEVPEDGVELIIKAVSQEVVGDEQSEKYALHFRDKNYKPLLLNKTNIRVLVDLYGGESEAWLGQPIVVYSDPNISYGGKRIGGVRLRNPQPTRRPGPHRPGPAPAGWPDQTTRGLSGPANASPDPRANGNMGGSGMDDLDNDIPL